MYVFSKRVIGLLLVFLSLLTGLTGCSRKSADARLSPPPAVDLPDTRRLAAEVSEDWRQSTAQFLRLASVQGLEAAGYMEPPSLFPGKATKLKLYTSAWTAALINQVGLQSDPEKTAAMRGWINELVQSDFTFDGGSLTLHNLYPYYLLQSSLGQPVDRAASLRALVKLRQPNGLYAWDERGKAELAATQIATELLAGLGVYQEIMAPTREALLELLADSSWQEATDAKEALTQTGGPLLLSAYHLGLPLDSRATEFVSQWNQQFQEPSNADLVTVEFLFQLVKLNHATGQTLTLSPEFQERLQSLRNASGGFSPNHELEFEPQLTYKVQEILRMTTDVHLLPEAAHHAADRFWGDSWVAHSLTQPKVIDTYNGLTVARILDQPVPDESAITAFLSARIETITANQPAVEQLAGAARELNYALQARELLTDPFELPDGTTEWVKTAADRVIIASTDAEVDTVSFLVEASARLGVALNPNAAIRALEGASYPEERFLEEAFLLTRAARALNVPPDVFRQHPAVEGVLSLTPTDGGYRVVADAPVPDLFSTYKVLEVLRFFAPDQAIEVLPAVRDFVRSLQDPTGGFQGMPGGSPMLRSTAEGLLLLGM